MPISKCVVENDTRQKNDTARVYNFKHEKIFLVFRL